jgi:DNA mismatch repair protein MutL
VGQVLGDEFAENVHNFEMSAGDFTVQGFLGSPDYTRVNRTGQKLFINGRPVVSPAINNALSRAYDEFLPARRFPVAVLFFDIAADNIDVNVHPAKREVRIRNERIFIEQITSAVRAELRKHGFHIQPDAASAV